jgi:hypothetical protein
MMAFLFQRVIGLQDALDAGGGSGGPVSWSQISGKPNFQSAAYSPTTAFATSAQGALASSAVQPGDPVSSLANDAAYLSGIQSDIFQHGIEALVMGQQEYAIVFATPMTATPEIELQVHLTDGSGELFYTGIRDDLTSGTGFTFKLNSAPVASAGHVHWTARVYP